MDRAIKLSEDVVSKAKVASKLLNRSLAEQIEHWVKIGKLAEENPDLTYKFIKNILVAREKARAGKKLESYNFGE